MKTLSSTLSSYSYLRSLNSVEDIVSIGKVLGYKAILLSDYGSLSGAHSFYHAAKKEGIHPLFGLMVSCQSHQYCVVAKNNEGFKELIKLSLHLSKEPLTIEVLTTYTKECVVIYSQENSPIEPLILQDEFEQALALLLEQSKLFTDFRVGFSLMKQPLFKQKNNQLYDLLSKTSLKGVVLELVYYKHPQDEQLLKVLQAIKYNTSIEDVRITSQPHHEFMEVSHRDMLFPNEILENTDELGDICQVDLSAFKTSLPTYINDYGVDSITFIRVLTLKGLRKRLNNQVTQTYLDRLEYELEVIIKLGFVDYFLIVYDFILFAKKNDILIGPGRGSAAASLVSYCLGITQVDPIKYDLIFERFLNPERVSMPDIDVDIEDTRRQEVIDYVRHKYGNKQVAHIMTFSTLSQKQVLRDVSKALCVKPEITNRILKTLIDKPKVLLQESLEASKELQAFIEREPKAKELFEISLKLEGLERQHSLHAAGIVISDKPVEEVIPVIDLGDEHYCTQYTMEQLSDYGLVKMDFLGLRNLSIISEINKSLDTRIDMNQIPLDDKKSYQLLAHNHTLGIFQLESAGMNVLLKQMQPSQFMDIVDALALYRPGPMNSRQIYLENKQQPSKLESIHPKVDPILKSTHGVLMYQEQVIEIARSFAGFSYAKSDTLRAAMSKKDAEKMALLKEDFIQVQPKDVAEKLWSLMERFAQYGFNKAHSVSYAMISYQLAYLKANYPLYFYCSLLNNVMSSLSKLKSVLLEIKQRKIDILGPSLNESQVNFVIQEGKIRVALSIISQIGLQSAKSIIAARENEPFKDYIDAVARLNKAKISQNKIENLIKAGCFDEFNLSRETMIHNLPEVLSYAGIIMIELDQQTLLDYSLMDKPQLVEFKDKDIQKATGEMEVLGFHLSSQPLTQLRQRIRVRDTLNKASEKPGSYEIVAALVEIRPLMTKKNEAMARVTLEDEVTRSEAVIFPRQYQKLKDQLQKQGLYLLKVSSQQNQGYQDLSLIINGLEKVG